MEVRLPPLPEGDKQRVWGLEGGSAPLPKAGSVLWRKVRRGRGVDVGCCYRSCQPLTLSALFLLLGICLPWPEDARPCQEEMQRQEAIIK